MGNINLPPFYVGQRVVAICNGNGEVMKKGDEFTVLGMKKCSCGLWGVDVGFVHQSGTYCKCGKYHEEKALYVIYTKLAPIDENFKSISLSKVLEEESKLISVN